MIRTTQGLVLVFLGAVLLRLSVGDAYLHYVNEWMRWPLIISGGLLVVLSLGPLFQTSPDAEKGEEAHQSHVPRATWLLLLPGLVAFVISPPALGAYLAEKGNTPPPPPPPVSAGFPELVGEEPIGIEVSEFTWRAADAEGATLTDRTVAMKGFVSTDADGNWYITRISINCCAADSAAYRIRVEDAEAPPRESWVRIAGTFVPGTGERDGSPAAISVSDLVSIKTPSNTYQ